MKLDSPVTILKGVGEELEKKLGQLGVKTVEDLLLNFPRRYEDYSTVLPIRELRPGDVTVEGTIGQISGRYVRRGLHITEAIASDATGSVRLIWFNQPYRAGSIKPGKSYFMAGEYQLSRSRFSIMNPSVELASDFPVNTARIIPVYKSVKGLRSTQIRRLVREAIKASADMKEPLPQWLVMKHKLMVYPRAVAEIHFPSSGEVLKRARKRLAFTEIFELTLAALENKREFSLGSALAIKFNESLARKFVSSLPFKLTDAQRKVVWQVYQSMARTQPMNRLVEGDVGSGKTVVAAMAALMAMEQGFQAAFMAPTEILARQHYQTLLGLLDSVGYGDEIGLLIGGLKPKEKSQVHQLVAGGKTRLIVGTHALISEKVDMRRLGLVIIDEQHRFGVAQRKKLQAKAGHMPHVLHMSATPIPRSLALTLYGELDISILDELPSGRRPIITKLASPNSRTQLVKAVNKQLEEGHQVFIVCPLISDTETSGGLSVEEVYERTQREFKNRQVGLLHGKMKTDSKDAVMQKFIAHELDILVSTTVIEVGVDVPNASVMVIEGAERFGLAQIHQLRGRVGRAQHQSFCYLVPSTSDAASQRLRVLETTSDGFRLAEIDLRLRGPGAIYGTTQHGALDLRIADLLDTKLIALARNSAQEFIDKNEKLSEYPHLSRRVSLLRAVTNLN